MRAGRKFFGVMSVHSTLENKEKTTLFGLGANDSAPTAFDFNFSLTIQASVFGLQLARISSQILSSWKGMGLVVESTKMTMCSKFSRHTCNLQWKQCDNSGKKASTTRMEHQFMVSEVLTVCNL